MPAHNLHCEFTFAVGGRSIHRGVGRLVQIAGRR